MDAISTKQHTYPIEFTGRGGQFFKIWIVNILLTIITVYIYSAWAKVRTKRYFYGNTVLDGSSFEYHAKPMQILISRLVAAGLFILVTFGGAIFPLIPVIATVVLFAIIPWAIWRSIKFNMRMTSYRNVRFGFEGKLWPVYLFIAIVPLCAYAVPIAAAIAVASLELGQVAMLVVIVGGILLNFVAFAFTQQRLVNYFVNGYRYGKSQFTGAVKLGSFVKIYALAIAFALGTMVLIAAVAYFAFAGLGLENLGAYLSEQADAIESEDPAALATFGLGFYGLFFFVGFFVVAIVRSRVRNLVFANAALDKKISFESNVSARGLWWIMVSNLFLVIITLGFARPFAQVRMAKFLAKRTHVSSMGALDGFVGEKREEVGAFGDELGDAFDMDMDVGF